MSYFDPWPIEKSGSLYRLLRVRAFRPFVAGGAFWQRLGLAKRRRWNTQQLRAYVRQSKPLEVTHLVSLLFLAGVAVYLGSNDDWLGVGVFTVLNVVANLYPLLVVRYNRHRVDNRLAKLDDAGEA
ncbi:MAG: hypothetical protein AAGH76_08930 [Pseudomonadota bacterium]